MIRQTLPVDKMSKSKTSPSQSWSRLPWSQQMRATRRSAHARTATRCSRASPSAAYAWNLYSAAVPAYVPGAVVYGAHAVLVGSRAARGVEAPCERRRRPAWRCRGLSMISCYRVGITGAAAQSSSQRPPDRSTRKTANSIP